MTLAYLRYLYAQWRQAWAKRHKPPHRIPDDALKVIMRNLGCHSTSVLCLGARSRQEPEWWRAQGFPHVQAVDLLPSRGVRFADMHRLPFADASFSLVVAAHVLEHAYDPPLALKEVCRVLNHGGLLWAAWPRGFTPNAHDRIDYGWSYNFANRIGRLHNVEMPWWNVEMLWNEDWATESRALIRVMK